VPNGTTSEFTGALHQAPSGVVWGGVECAMVMWGGAGLVVGGGAVRCGGVGCGGVGCITVKWVGWGEVLLEETASMLTQRCRATARTLHISHIWWTP